MNPKDKGRLRMMEKLCTDKGVNCSLLVLKNGVDACWSTESASFTSIEMLMFSMAKVEDTSDKATVYVNTKIRPIEVKDIEILIESGVIRIVSNNPIGDGLKENIKDLDIIIESES